MAWTSVWGVEKLRFDIIPPSRGHRNMPWERKSADTTYKAFYNQVAKPHFATFMGTMASRLIGDMTLKVLGFEKGRAFAEFRHIVIQDGSSFAIHDALREVFPGRFKVVKPAAVELHTTMDLLCDAPTTVVLTPDTASEQP